MSRFWMNDKDAREGELDVHEFAVLAIIRSRAGAKTWNMSYAEFGEHITKLSVSTAQRAVKSLVVKGYLIVEGRVMDGRQVKNRYRLGPRALGQTDQALGLSEQEERSEGPLLPVSVTDVRNSIRSSKEDRRKNATEVGTPAAVAASVPPARAEGEDGRALWSRLDAETRARLLDLSRLIQNAPRPDMDRLFYSLAYEQNTEALEEFLRQAVFSGGHTFSGETLAAVQTDHVRELLRLNDILPPADPWAVPEHQSEGPAPFLVQEQEENWTTEHDPWMAPAVYRDDDEF